MTRIKAGWLCRHWALRAALRKLKLCWKLFLQHRFHRTSVITGRRVMQDDYFISVTILSSDSPEYPVICQVIPNRQNLSQQLKKLPEIIFLGKALAHFWILDWGFWSLEYGILRYPEISQDFSFWDCMPLSWNNTQSSKNIHLSCTWDIPRNFVFAWPLPYASPSTVWQPRLSWNHLSTINPSPFKCIMIEPHSKLSRWFSDRQG